MNVPFYIPYLQLIKNFHERVDKKWALWDKPNQIIPGGRPGYRKNFHIVKS
jgi:hypothetical protein